MWSRHVFVGFTQISWSWYTVLWIKKQRWPIACHFCGRWLGDASVLSAGPCDPERRRSCQYVWRLSEAERWILSSHPSGPLYVYRSKTMKRREKEPATDKVQQKLNVSVLWHHGKWQMMCVNAVEPIWCERINSSGQVRHAAASLCCVCCDLLQRCCNKPSDCRETPRELEDKAANFKRE